MLSVELEISDSVRNDSRIVLSSVDDCWKAVHTEKYSDTNIKKLVENQVAREIINIIRPLKLRVLAEFAEGLNGTQYKLILRNGFNTTTYSWWNELPVAWLDLRNVVNALFLLVNSKKRI